MSLADLMAISAVEVTAFHEGWAWGSRAIKEVDVSTDNGGKWHAAQVTARVGFEWQAFRIDVGLAPGRHGLVCRARTIDGVEQPLAQCRNQVHRLAVAAF